MAVPSFAELATCKPGQETWFWFHSRCGKDRDCVGDDRATPFKLGYCNAIVWCRKNPGTGRFVEVWSPDNKFMVFKMTERNSTSSKARRCDEWVRAGAFSSFTFNNSDDVFTVNIPGLSDILKLPGIDNAATRRDRARRMIESRSAMPTGLQWIPKLLNKLDDAQDLLYTGLVIGVALLKFIGVRMFPGLGILLTANDMLNFFG